MYVYYQEIYPQNVILCYCVLFAVGWLVNIFVFLIIIHILVARL